MVKFFGVVASILFLILAGYSLAVRGWFLVPIFLLLAVTVFMNSRRNYKSDDYL